MKEAGPNSVADCFDSKALYDNMLKILDKFLLEKLEDKQVKFMDIEVEKSFDIMRKLLVQNAGIDSLEFQEINCKHLRFLNENEKNVVESTLVFHDELKQKKLQDEEDTLEERLKRCVSQGRSDLFEVKMENSSSSKIAPEGTSKIKLKLPQVSQPQKDDKIQSSNGTYKDEEKPSSHGPQKDEEKTESQTKVATERQLKPEWLDRFLRKAFFEPCSKHPIRRNDLNKYCIDCDASLCQYCMSLASHSRHRVLKIYRHVYKDVVPLDEIVRHIDITKIQPYRCNRQMVIALTPLPHSGTGKIGEATCLTCNRKLIEHGLNDYCSIACKVEAFMNKQSDSDLPHLSLEQTEQNPKEQNPKEESSPMKTRKRKGVPHRAPLS